MKTALTIAGSDCSGGAGIQADMKTMMAHGVYAMSVITAITAQNTRGVSGVMEVPPEFVTQQLDAVFTDIFPDAVKIGMVSSGKLITAIADALRRHRAANIVLDPVMVSTSGSRLLCEEAVSELKEKLLPLAAVITPNIPEAEVLWGHSITSPAHMEMAAQEISQAYKTAVLCKGGHNINDANDLLYAEGKAQWFRDRKSTRLNSSH